MAIGSFDTENERNQRDAQRNYEFQKNACKQDGAGMRCKTCLRRGTPDCFDPEKEQKEGWKWS